MEEHSAVHSELTLPKVALIFLNYFHQSGCVKPYGFISAHLLCVCVFVRIIRSQRVAQMFSRP